MKLFKQARKYGSRIAAGAALLVGFGAYAALPDGVSTGFTQLQTDGLAMADLAWPVVIALTVSLILFKLYKRYIAKV